MKLHINPKLLPYFKQFSFFVQLDKGTGTKAGVMFGIEIINDKSVERWEWR
jgi:hypothetical protein